MKLSRQDTKTAEDVVGNVRAGRRSASKKVAANQLPERTRELIDFHEHYEALVDALCDAAHYGPNIVLDRRYSEAREEIRSRYPALRAFLICYLEFLQEDAEAGLKLWGRPMDAFEALTAAFDLQEFFAMDDGNMISRITRTREALNAYGEHLRLLVARAA